MNQAVEQPAVRRGPFGTTVDPVEAGRRGGQASARARKMKPLRELEARIAQSRNGAAIYGLYQVELKRSQELERERLRADRELVQLMHWTDQERETLADLTRREKLLRESIAANQTALVDRLRALHDDGGLEPVLIELDVFEQVPDVEA
jgi:hypothetical protein